MMKGKSSELLGSIGGALSLFLGVFLTIVGSVKIPLGSSIRKCGLTVCYAKDYLYAPTMVPLGIGLLVIGIILVIVSIYRERNIKKV